MKQLFLCIFVLIVLKIAFGTDVWNYFGSNESFDGKICIDADISFNKKTLPRSKMGCFIECMNHADCVSVFHVQETGDCTGCGVRYDNADLFGATEQMDGTKYYEIQSVLPPIYYLELYRNIGCHAGWAGFASSCYFLTTEALIFQKGIEKCQLLNAEAVKIQDETENNYIKEYLLSMNYQIGDWAYFTAYTNTSDVWTAYDSSNVITFDNWAPDEPSQDPSKNCLAFFLLQNLQWISYPCNDELRMICEMKRI